MKLTVLGCAGSYPGPDSPCSSYLLQADGFSLLVDLGNGALTNLQRLHGLFDVDAVVVSHLHPDHWSDLCPYMVVRKYARRHGSPALPPLPVYGPTGTQERLGSTWGDQSASSGVFDYHVLTPGTGKIGPFEVTTALMNHPVETYGLRISHDGHALAYSADTGPCQALIELASGADTLLCEAAFVDEPDNTPDLHLTGRQAAEHATAAGVERLLLTHLVAWNDSSRTYAEARAAFDGSLDVVRCGSVYDI